MEKHYIYLVMLFIILILIYYLYNIMNNIPIYAIAVFNDTIKGTCEIKRKFENRKCW